MAVWRSRPVFVSSTFRDMQTERDHLARFVFPALEERLKERFHHLEPIDLRWGVETGAAADQEQKEFLVLKVCLGEIERSRPFLVALLGDRYGWVPPESRMRAAAQEAGYEGALVGKSVTALEIEFGVLANADQCRRSRFYFRDPLPYTQMDAQTAAQFSDKYSPDPDVRGRHDELEALKGEITETMRRWGTPERVRPYSVTWDAAKNGITGLEAWGAQVLADLWSDLEEETRAFLGLPTETWQERERLELEAFIELACRDFRGREDVLRTLKAHALSPASHQGVWGICLAGAAGAGKSALLARLARDLEHEALVLTHAAGVSPRSQQVDDLLRRFIWELASSLGIPDPAAGLTAREDLERTFGQLLSLAARRRRVVVLIDALNQFERTPSAMHLTWLPKILPENARFIAGTIAGIESEALAGRAGVELQALPALSQTEAGAIIVSIGTRYHKAVNPDVEAELLAKRGPDGALSAGNPLWLTLALEELLLLDADDFARASRTYDGTEEQKLHALLVDTARELPEAVETLYGQMLARNEEVHGTRWASAFAKLIAATRSGLRESDLERLLPLETGETWEPLRLAALRRSFRAHLVRRGALVQWDFFHAQMREAVRKRHFGDPAEGRRIHTVLADHLEALPREDVLRQTELMVHLIGADDRLRAARHFGAVTLSAAENTGATRALAAHIVAGQERDRNEGLAWVTSLVDLDGIEATTSGALCHRLIFDLHDALVSETRLGTQLTLLQAGRATLERLAVSNPANARWERDLSVSHNRIGDVLLAQGDATAALDDYRKGLTTFERLAESDPTNMMWQSDLGISNERIGSALEARGDLAGALAAFKREEQIVSRHVASDPTNADWQLGLSISHEKIGDVMVAQGSTAAAIDAYRKSLVIRERLAASDPTNARWQRNISVSHIKIGDVLLTEGDAGAAIEAIRKSLAIRERLAASDPTNPGWQNDLSEGDARIGDVLLAQGDAAAALDAYRKSYAIRKCLAVSDPANAGWQHDLSVSHEQIGNVLLAQGDSAAALDAYRKSLAIIEPLAQSHPTNARWQRDISVSHIVIGDILLAQGDAAAALSSYRKSLAIAERLAASDPTNALWQHDLAGSHEKIGSVLLAQGDAAAARDEFAKILAIRERLAASDPTNAGWQHDLSVSHEKVGNVLLAQEDAAAARDEYAKSLAIRERLAASDPTNEGWQRDLSVSHNKIGNVLLAQGDAAAARDAYGKSLSIRQRLATCDPTNTSWQSDLSISHMRIGDVLLAQGDNAAALAAYREGLAILERLVTVDPANATWQHNLAVIQKNIDEAGTLVAYGQFIAFAALLSPPPDPADAGRPPDPYAYLMNADQLMALGNAAAALDAYRKGVTILERLAAAEPTNTGWQSDLSMSYADIAKALAKQGDNAAALIAYRKGVAIIERLVAANPTNAALQDRLSVSHENIRDMLRDMRRSGMPLDPTNAQFLDQVERLPQVGSDARRVPSPDRRAAKKPWWKPW